MGFDLQPGSLAARSARREKNRKEEGEWEQKEIMHTWSSCMLTGKVPLTSQLAEASPHVLVTGLA
eukprot:1156396-Pelagomonas_calceolata.AAC.2